MRVKRFFSAALTLALLLGTLSGAALAAAWPPADSDTWTNLTLAQAESVAADILTGEGTQDVILVYYSEGCGYSKSNVPQFVDYAAQNGLTLQGYDNDSEGALTGYFRLAESSRVEFPAVVVYHHAQGSAVVGNGVRDLSFFQELLDHAGLTGGSTDQPEPEPEPSSDPSEGMERQDDASISSDEWEVLRLTNIHRLEFGVSPLSIFDAIQMAGNQRGYEQMTLYSHDRPDGSSCFTALGDYQVKYSTAAENIAMGYRSAAAVVDGWLNSSGHRKNIENSDLTHIGVGASDGNHWVQIFAGSSQCTYHDLTLSQSGLTVPNGDLEAALAQADIRVSANCSRHGGCTLPLTAGMCDGFSPDAEGEQTLTVTLGGATGSLTATVVTPSPTPEAAPSQTPSVTPSATPTPSATSTPSPSATPKPSPKPSAKPSAAPISGPGDESAWSGGWDLIPDVGTAYASTQEVEIDGTRVRFEMYALKDANGNDTNYIKVRDLAYALRDTPARFDVDWDGAVCLSPGARYHANGSEFDTPFQGDRSYRAVYDDTMVDGVGRAIQAILLTDDSGGGYTYYKLRDLGRILDFNVSWSNDRGVYLETAEPYKG